LFLALFKPINPTKSSPSNPIKPSTPFCLLPYPLKIYLLIKHPVPIFDSRRKTYRIPKQYDQDTNKINLQMRKGRIVIMVISGLILIAFLFLIDYSNIKSRPNLGYLLGMLSAAFNILAMVLSNRHERKQAMAKK
jgi:hypothetical protein